METVSSVLMNLNTLRCITMCLVLCHVTIRTWKGKSWPWECLMSNVCVHENDCIVVLMEWRETMACSVEQLPRDAAVLPLQVGVQQPTFPPSFAIIILHGTTAEGPCHRLMRVSLSVWIFPKRLNKLWYTWYKEFSDREMREKFLEQTNAQQWWYNLSVSTISTINRPLIPKTNSCTYLLSTVWDTPSYKLRTASSDTLRSVVLPTDRLSTGWSLNLLSAHAVISHHAVTITHWSGRLIKSS